jgi:3-deoxy-manno-octulosonate cytidylyltransferase (CMP-KDO synthetase)
LKPVDLSQETHDRAAKYHRRHTGPDGVEPIAGKADGGYWRHADDCEANVGDVLVAAADLAIAEAIKDVGGDAIMTEPRLSSGSDRVAAALAFRDPDKRYRFVVNLQGDLPTIDPMAVKRCLAGLMNEQVDIATIAAAITDEQDAANPNIVKAIAALSPDREVAYARDFVRRLLPEHAPPYWHHIGIYAYKRAALERFVSLPVSALEKERSLEQMRALENDMRIAVVQVDSVPLGVDTAADLDLARRMLKPVS